MRIALLAMWCMVAGMAGSSAQEPVFEQYTTGNGLPSNMIYDIYRDGKGYLWFATNNGIARYDGIRFDTYSTAHGLPDNELFFFKEDYNGRLWISTFNGELCYYKNGKFHTAANTGFLKLPFQASDIRFITLHPDSSVSICFMNQDDYFVNIRGETLSTIDMRRMNVRHTQIQCITKTAPGIYDIIAGTNHTRIDSSGAILHTGAVKNGKGYHVSYGQDSVYLFDDRAVYDAGQRIIYRFNSAPARDIIRIYFSAGRPVLGTRNGLVFADRLLLAHEKISPITQDINGNLWIGSLGNGAFKLKNNYKRYTVRKNVYEGVATCSYNTAHGLLFATSANKLYRMQKEQAGTVNLTDSVPSANKSVQYINRDLFYTYDGNRLAAVPHSSDKPAAKQFYALKVQTLPKTMMIDDSIAWFHYLREIYFTNYAKEGFRLLTKKTNRIFWMAKDADGQVWFTTKRMYKIAGGTPVLQHQFDDLSLKWFRFFGHYLIGATQNGQLIVTKTANKNKLVYSTIRDVCKWENAYRIDERHILLSTDGLYRLMTIAPSATDSVRFSMTIIENEFIPSGAEHIVSYGSQVHFFSKGHIYSFPISELLVKPTPPIISDVLFRTAKGYYPTRPHIRISHREARNILISFRVLSFDSKNISYQYSISGKHDNWITTQVPDINLVAPGYGDHQVNIRALTQSGVASKVYTLHVTILKPYYLQWWFLVAAFGVLCGLLFLAVRVRIHYLLAKREKEYHLKMKVVKSEYKALNALMNPHFIFNSLNSIQGFINKGNKASANLYLTLFSRLVRQNMHNISKEVILLSEEIELVKNYLLLEKMRFKDRFEYIIEVQDDVDDTDIFIPPLLIQPLTENAIKHGLLPRRSADNKLWIRIGLVPDKLVIEVEDNGVGFPLQDTGDGDKTHQSYALGNIHARIAQLNELHHNVIQLHIHSRGANHGTRIEIEIDTDRLAQYTKDRF